MLATVLGILGIVPLVVGAVALTALIIAGCSGSKEEEDVKDAAPLPKPCDAFDKGSGETHIDQQSFDAMKNVWDEDFAKANTENWHRHTRIYFGAAAPLYKTTCENPTLLDGDAGELIDGTKLFFEDYYATKANSADDGVLVLIGGLAPADVANTVVAGGLEAMSAADVTQADFAELLTACHFYNKAIAFGGVKDRYSNPSGRKLSKGQKEAAETWLELAQPILDRFMGMDEVALNEALTDRQQEILFILGQAVESYGNTIKIGDPPPPIPCKLTKEDCDKLGNVLNLAKCKCVSICKLTEAFCKKQKKKLDPTGCKCVDPSKGWGAPVQGSNS
jgi:hypothetical protein